MRTVCQKVYKFDELSEEAKEKAITDYSDGLDYGWGSDNEAVLKAFESNFPVKVGNWSYGICGNSYINFELNVDEEIEQLTGIRLMKWLYNNYGYILYPGKQFFINIYNDGKYTYKSRRSKIIKDNDCVLTGYCVDIDTLKPIYDFLKQPNNYTNLYDLMNDCLHGWLQACISDVEYYYGEENIIEMIASNECEFSEDGSIY